MSEPSVVVVLCTASGEKEAQNIAQALVQRVPETAATLVTSLMPDEQHV